MLRSPRRSPSRPPLAPLALAGLLTSALLAGCGAADDAAPARSESSPAAPASDRATGADGADEATGAEPDPDAPTGWGPTEGELAQARETVAGWDAARLAGQVVVGRYRGTDPAEAAALVGDLGLAGLSVTAENVVDADQVRALTAAVGEAHAATGRAWPPVLGVDQEGGVVSHLDGVATDFPSFATAGTVVETDGRAGQRVVRDAAEALALELRALGFTWVWAPVGDVTVGAADPTIGSRSPSEEPQVASRAVASALRGYRDAALASTVKHFPGHGSVTADSHEVLPLLDASLAELQARDLVPFRRAVEVGAPAVMVGHLDTRAVAPGVPSSTAPEVYDLLRDDLGFEGVAVTDSLGMGAVAAVPKPAVAALAAGADLLLMPVDTRRTVGTLTAAIEDGTVPRERAEEAAARVVALQLWLARTTGEVAVPEDADARAAEAARALEEAAY
ncbi:glycoside hydrolase family 3 protein [Nocardioides perillae]|uniref:Beta-N-acetylhexosaminidase n=1 Tax=Nocardioides perillae TaxID=1119534 RepID=A0A7Y9UN83_9ACTN|nr:beta-N-acetylhexosaminidase [Nocardioides perillae]